MRKTIAIFLTIIYTCFITGSLWSAPVSGYYCIERSTEESNKEINDPEPFKDFEAPNFSKVVKNLPVKIKLSRAHYNLFYLRKPLADDAFALKKPIPRSRSVILHNTPLFIKNNVFRI